MGEGARRGLPDSVTVADRLGFLVSGEVVGMTGEVAVLFGGGAGWGGLVDGSCRMDGADLLRALPRERRLRILAPRSCCVSATGGCGASRPLVLERRACAVIGYSSKRSSSKTGRGAKPRNGKVAADFAGDWDRNCKIGELGDEIGEMRGGDILRGV